MKNKICLKYGYLWDVVFVNYFCSLGECGVNFFMQYIIGDEFIWVREGMVEFFCEDGIEVKGVIIDLDSLVGWVVDFFFKNGLYKVKLVYYLDIWYFFESIRKFIKRDEKFLQVMFCRMKVEKIKFLYNFVFDVVDRCMVEIN